MSGDSKRADFRSSPFPQWRHDFSRVSVCFTGRVGGDRRPAGGELLRQLADAPPSLAWLKQCHSATVRLAASGDCGDGDGFWTQRTDVALSIVTADCVPIVCASDRVLAAIHAGWRGLTSGIIEATLTELPSPISELEAWLGPAIGPCCYEVGDDVAARVIAATEPSIALAGSTGRPHVDLHRAAQFQLQRLGVGSVHRIEACTKCNPDLLWSYRGSSGTNGRNFSFAWLCDRERGLDPQA